MIPVPTSDGPAPRYRTYPAKGVHGRLLDMLGPRILGGEWQPGDLLPREAELVEQLHVSRTAVREAIKVLAAKGLVETRQKSGTRIRQRRMWNLLDPDVLAWQAVVGVDPALTVQMVELRRLIEPVAARLAALRRDDETLAEIDAAYRAMCAATADPVPYYEADLAFHRAIFAATGNQFIDRLGAIVATILEVSFSLQQRSLIDWTTGLPLHQRVLGAIRDGEADEAEAAMLAIIEVAKDELSRVAAAAI